MKPLPTLNTTIPSGNILIIAPYLFGKVGGAEKIIRQLIDFLVWKKRDYDFITNIDLGYHLLNYNFDFSIELPKALPKAVINKLSSAEVIFAFSFSTLRLLNHFNVKKKIIFIPFETVSSLTSTRRIYGEFLLQRMNVTNVIVFSDYFKDMMTKMNYINCILIRYNLPKNEQSNNLHLTQTKKTRNKIAFIPARISPRKNLEDLIEIATILKNVSVDCVVSGGLLDTRYTKYAEKIRKMNDAFGSPVKFFDTSLNAQEMDSLFRKSFCVLSTSHIEGFGIFALEALNYLKPVICFDSVGIKEIAEKGNFFNDGIHLAKNAKEMVDFIYKILHSDYACIQQQIKNEINIFNNIVSFEKQLDNIF